MMLNECDFFFPSFSKPGNLILYINWHWL